MLRPSILLSLSALALGTASPGQLAGDYTIDPNGTGARNYPSLAAVTNDLATRGISGPVRFVTNFASRDESFTIPPTAGVSATNTITFQAWAKGTSLSGTGQDWVVVDSRHVILDGFSMTRTTGPLNGACVSGSYSDLEIRNCRFVTSRDYLGVAVNGHVHHCQFSGVPGGIRGHVHDNHFHCTDRGDRLSVDLYGRIYNNLFTGAGSANGIIKLSDTGCDFWHNTVSLSASRWAIRITYGALQGTATSFHNNIIDVQGGGGAIEMWTISSTTLRLESDFNLYSVPSRKIALVQSTTYTDLNAWGAWLSRGGQNPIAELNSFTASPRFRSSSDQRLLADSPAINRADVRVVSRNSGTPVVVDFDGWQRGDLRDLGCFELGGWDYTGTGCAGTGSSPPQLTITGDVGPGKFTRFHLAGALPRTTPLFVIGMQQAVIPLGGACELFTAPLLVLPGATTTASGTSYLEFLLGLNQAAPGLTAITQYTVPDPKAPGAGFALTGGGVIRL